MKTKRKVIFCLLAGFAWFVFYSQKAIDIKFIDNLPDSIKADTLNRLSKLYRLNDFKTSLLYSQKALEVAEQVNDSAQIGNAYNGMGNSNHLLGNYQEAVKNYILAYKLFEKLKSIKGLGSACLNLGVLNADKKNYPEALKYYHKAAGYSAQSGNLINTASVYNNIGSVYTDLGMLDSALVYVFKALELKKTFKNMDVMQKMGNSYSNIAIIYMRKKDFESAEKYYRLAYREDLISKDLNSMAQTLSNLGDLYFTKGDNVKALKYFKEAEDTTNKIQLKPLLLDIYWNFGALYKKTGNYKLATFYLERYAQLKDSLDGVKNHEVLEELQARYESEKKETEINLLNKDNQLQYAQLAQEKKTRYFLIGIVLVILFSGGFVFNAYRNKKRANELLKEKNSLIQSQKNLLSEKNKEILDSINYAKNLQDAIMPPLSLIKQYLPGTFIFYKPKDIVAGDFYWFHANGDKVFLAVADCTGHGVPGAMVSMICSNALNRAVKELGLKDPGEILDAVTKLVIETYEKSENEVKDGMDISFVCITKSKSSYQLEWAGANNPLWYIEKNNFFTIKADKQPIGKFDNNKPFTTHTLTLTAGDKLYLITDGYADQFGGERGKKYKYAPLKELLLKNSNTSSEEQHAVLQKDFTGWKGRLEQVDDVTIVGVNL